MLLLERRLVSPDDKMLRYLQHHFHKFEGMETPVGTTGQRAARSGRAVADTRPAPGYGPAIRLRAWVKVKSSTSRLAGRSAGPSEVAKGLGELKRYRGAPYP